MVQVVGGFSQGGRPAQGLIQFIPSRLWVIDEGTAWATLAPTVRLDEHGNFAVLLTPTNADTVPWCYLVKCETGSWLIRPQGTRLLHLRELVDEYRSGPRAAH